MEKSIKASVEEALKRMRQADEKLTRAQQGGRVGEADLAESLNEYNSCVAELADYLNVSSRHRGKEAEWREARQG